MAYTKKSINEKYNKLRAQLKAGTIDQKTFKAAANRLYELYHSDANKATRNAPKPKPKSSPKLKTTTKSKSSPKPKAGGKTGADVLSLGGKVVKKGTLKKKLKGTAPSTSSNFMSSSSTYTGKNLKKPEPKVTGKSYQRRRRGM